MEVIFILQFHHIKYAELDGYDEVVLINHDIHNHITRDNKRSVPKDILKKASIRLSSLKERPHSEFCGPFCLIKKRRYVKGENKLIYINKKERQEEREKVNNKLINNWLKEHYYENINEYYEKIECFKKGLIIHESISDEYNSKMYDKYIQDNFTKLFYMKMGQFAIINIDEIGIKEENLINHVYGLNKVFVAGLLLFKGYIDGVNIKIKRTGYVFDGCDYKCYANMKTDVYCEQPSDNEIKRVEEWLSGHPEFFKNGR